MMIQERNGMAQASMVLGILSVAGICCCYGGVMFGSLAVIFAFLSKTEEHMADSAKIGLITGIIGILLSVLAILILIVMWGISMFAVDGGGIHI